MGSSQPRYQGARSRWATRAIMGIWLGILFVGPDLVQQASLGQRLVRLAITAVVIAMCDVWFTRRMGLTLASDRIILHYVWGRRTVPWTGIRGFQWRRWRSAKTEFLWIVTDNQPIRIPTVQRVTRGPSLFGSESFRSSTGDTDAVRTLPAALARAMQTRPVTDDGGSALSQLGSPRSGG
jgi:hypothetical protein